MSKVLNMLSYKFSAVRMLLAAAFIFFIMGIPLFSTGALRKDSTPAEKVRWQLGFIAIGTGLGLSTSAGVICVGRGLAAAWKTRNNESNADDI
jgi:hypothetical protein